MLGIMGLNGSQTGLRMILRGGRRVGIRRLRIGIFLKALIGLMVR
jgi:hypothetical protein